MCCGCGLLSWFVVLCWLLSFVGRCCVRVSLFSGCCCLLLLVVICCRGSLFVVVCVLLVAVVCFLLLVVVFVGVGVCVARFSLYDVVCRSCLCLLCIVFVCCSLRVVCCACLIVAGCCLLRCWFLLFCW